MTTDRKKHICSIALASLLILSVLLLSGCSVWMFTNQPQTIESFPEESAPSQIIKTEDQWVMLHHVYGGKEYSISVGEDLNSRNSIYHVNDVSIWYFAANETGIVWCEYSEEFYTFKLYDFETETVETVFQTETDQFQAQNVGIYQNAVYYCVVDYDRQELQVIAYDIPSKTASCISRAEYKEKNSPYTINLQGPYLSVVCAGEIRVCDLQSNETVFDRLLPDTVIYAYTASYDRINHTCALYYYADDDSEHIGVLKEGESDLLPVYTFAEHHYAYQEKIECDDGHICWITQANVSGRISDHYKFVDYDYLKQKSTGTDRTFSFFRSEDGLYLLRFNQRGDYTHIDLCSYP